MLYFGNLAVSVCLQFSFSFSSLCLKAETARANSFKPPTLLMSEVTLGPPTLLQYTDIIRKSY